MRWILFFTLLNFNFSIFAQSSTIRGRILEAGSLEPVSFATVYVNGTTKGSVTDDLGQYELNEVSFPAEIVVSHLSYESEVLYLERPTDKRLVFHLRARAIDLSSVKVVDNDRRQKNILEFEKLFLGVDPIGEKATLENPEVLLFDRDYRKVKDRMVTMINGMFKEDSLNFGKTPYREIPVNFKVKGKAPIIVDQPELGYKIQVDLASFQTNYPTKDNRLTGTYWLGYYFFEPYSEVSKGKQKRFARNRLLAYYNSPQHLLRSIYEKTMKQNGYRIMERVQDSITHKASFVDYDIYQNIEYNEEGEAVFVNLKDKFLRIFYYAKANGKPNDITKKVKGILVDSSVLFSSDRCLFRANGTMPEITIRFSGRMAEKKVGSMLPDNYEPINERISGWRLWLNFNWFLDLAELPNLFRDI